MRGIPRVNKSIWYIDIQVFWYLARTNPIFLPSIQIDRPFLPSMQENPIHSVAKILPNEMQRSAFSLLQRSDRSLSRACSIDYTCVNMAIQVHDVQVVPHKPSPQLNHNEIPVPQSRVRGTNALLCPSQLAEREDSRSKFCFATRMEKTMAGGGRH